MIIVLSTYPNKESAESAAVDIVRKEFAGCVNILRIENSVYRWKGKVESHPEFLLLIKTNQKAYLQLEEFIKKTHPYDVPEIIYFDVKGGNKEYIKWIDENTLSKLLGVSLDVKKTAEKPQPIPR